MNDKISKFLKYFILIVGIIVLVFLFLSNIFFYTDISHDLLELADIKFNNPLYIIIIIIAGFIIYKLLDIIDKKLSTKNKKILFFIVLGLFILIQILWIIYRNLYPYGDQLSVYDVAKFIYNGNTSKLLNNRYLQLCPQQINISIVWSIIFKIFHSTNIKIMQYINVIANVGSLITLLKISDELEPKYNINKTRLVFLFVTFSPILLLATFPYGDLPGLALSLLAILFVLKYNNTNKIYYIFISSLFMMLACLIRINYIIFFIAILIYLVLCLIRKYKNIKDLIIKLLLIIVYSLVTILPNQILKTSFQNKYKLNKDYSLPTSAYLYVAMTESERGNGWYGANIIYAWEHPGESDAYYKKQISKRLNYFKNNPLYFIEFYVKKELSMWTENTYQSIWYNESFNIGKTKYQNYSIDKQLLSYYRIIFLYQKMIILMISASTLYYVFKNRKELNNGVLLFLLVFMGGFFFHTLWEAKSRYIIPYLIILIIPASLSINKKKHTN